MSHLSDSTSISSLAFLLVRWTRTCRQWRRRQSPSRSYKMTLTTNCICIKCQQSRWNRTMLDTTASAEDITVSVNKIIQKVKD